MSDNSYLESSICIRLATIHQPTKKGFAGTGQSRRREKSSAAAIAKSIVAGVRVNHRIERAGVSIDDAELIKLLATALWNVPEGLATDMVGIDANKREAAREAIARTLFVALTDNYTCTFFQPEHHGMKESLANVPGSAFYSRRS
ncbi:hypothetical protein [Ensifer sp. LC163]|uniref:hypothetical protein n=1 Tax=Ensifer sp. LC163 TaxID=1120652 RepID=UPI00081320F2|nr:hypothetical protein [Ensifer sp. LC163]OCP36725.1 hypothetical protein BC360_05035 [Ensifer sp. LC163]